MSKISIALLVSGVCGAAWAGKPKVAVLGLEVVASKGKPDAATLAAAHDLTDALRARAKAGTGPWELAPGSDKDLADLKRKNKCANEATACMAVIGNDLGAETLLFGKLEKTATDYRLTVRLLDVRTKSARAALTDTLPTSATATDVQAFGKKVFAKLADTTAPKP
jgi:hypothetical protein